MSEENIVDKTTQARANLERMRNITAQCFAILCQLCSWNPNEHAEQDEAFSETDSKQQENDEPPAALPDPANCGPVELSDSKDLVVVDEENLEPVGKSRFDEGGKQYEDIKKTCRLYAKKIAQLTHPDKISRFSSKTKMELLELFAQAKIDYEELNQYGLVYGYVRVRSLRGEIDKVPAELLELIEGEYRWVVYQINHILKLPYAPAVSAYCEGNRPLAVTLFKEYIASVRGADHVSVN